MRASIFSLIANLLLHFLAIHSIFTNIDCVEGTFVRKYPNKFGILLTYSYLCSVESEEPDGVPHFSLIKLMQMIDKNLVESVVNEWLTGKDYFLVDVTISADDCIVVTIDHAEGVWIEDCAALSRFLQERLGDELGEFELEVGSAGIGQPFKVEQQYINHIGDELEVLGADGKKVQGILKEVNGREFVLTTKEKQTVDGKKRPMMVDVDRTFSMDTVKYAKYQLTFK